MEENYIWPEITEETTLEEVREIHKKIWDYVIEHGEKPETPYDNDCVLCEYNFLHVDSCIPCQAMWGGGWCTSPTYEYVEWLVSSGEEKEYWAKRVRDIPFREVE